MAERLQKRAGWRWLWPLSALPLAAFAVHQTDTVWVHVPPLPVASSWTPKAQSDIGEADHGTANGQPLASEATAIRAAAYAALTKAPLDAPALRQLGIVSLLGGDGTGIALLQLAERVSRRDLPTQFALIEHAAQTDDVKGALRHYNRALSVSPESKTLLFPLLAKALQHPSIRTSLGAYYARDWFVEFVRRAGALEADPLALSMVLSSARQQLSNKLYGELRGNLITQLLAAGDVNSARKLAGPQAIEMGFSSFTSDAEHGALGWQIADNEVAKATIKNSGQLAISIESNRSSEVARRITLLEPGHYTLFQDQVTLPNIPRARVTWKVRCLGRASQPLAEAVFRDKEGRSSEQMTFDVPEGCPAQDWRLSATSSLSQFSSEIRLGPVRLVRGQAGR